MRLYREQGRFDEAERLIQTLDERDVGVTSNLITRLIKEKQPTPMRYMMCSGLEKLADEFF